MANYCHESLFLLRVKKGVSASFLAEKCSGGLDFALDNRLGQKWPGLRYGPGWVRPCGRIPGGGGYPDRNGCRVPPFVGLLKPLSWGIRRANRPLMERPEFSFTDGAQIGSKIQIYRAGGWSAYLRRFSHTFPYLSALRNHLMKGGSVFGWARPRKIHTFVFHTFSHMKLARRQIGAKLGGLGEFWTLGSFFLSNRLGGVSNFPTIRGECHGWGGLTFRPFL